jgi:hypothetical protein
MKRKYRTIKRFLFFNNFNERLSWFIVIPLWGREADIFSRDWFHVFYNTLFNYLFIYFFFLPRYLLIYTYYLNIKWLIFHNSPIPAATDIITTDSVVAYHVTCVFVIGEPERSHGSRRALRIFPRFPQLFIYVDYVVFVRVCICPCEFFPYIFGFPSMARIFLT